MAAVMGVTYHKRTTATAFDRCLQIIKMCNFFQFFASFTRENSYTAFSAS